MIGFITLGIGLLFLFGLALSYILFGKIGGSGSCAATCGKHSPLRGNPRPAPRPLERLRESGISARTECVGPGPFPKGIVLKVLLVVSSFHHRNTEKIADVFAKVFDARIRTPQQTDLVQTQQPKDATHWSAREIAKHVGISHTKVHSSDDPAFEQKLEDIVGLYFNPPENAIVLSIDEKSQVQALERAQPILPLRQGIP